MIKLIIFDWDDVFTQGSTEGYYACYHEALVRVGISLSEEEEIKRIKVKWGSTAREELAELLKEYPELVDKATEEYEQILVGNTFVDCLRLVPGSDALLTRLATRYKLAIASGVNPTLLKERIFPQFGIPNVFSHILTAYDVTDPALAKPHPYLAQEIMRRTGATPEETIMVGDAKSDVAMTKSAGITPVVVLTGHLTKEEALDLGVEYIIPSVVHLEEVLNKLNAI